MTDGSKMTKAQRRLVSAVADAVEANNGKAVVLTTQWWGRVNSQYRTLVACVTAGYLRRCDASGQRYWSVSDDAYRKIGREKPAEPRQYMKVTARVQRNRRCEAQARKGTGTGTCDEPLDEDGYCDRPGDHICEAPEAPPGITWDELRQLEEGLR